MVAVDMQAFVLICTPPFPNVPSKNSSQIIASFYIFHI